MSIQKPNQYPESAERLPLQGRGAVLETIHGLQLPPPPEAHVVIGGASLVLRGIKEDTEDVDMLVPGLFLHALAEWPGATVKDPPPQARYKGSTNKTIWIKDDSLPMPVSATDRLGEGYYPMSFKRLRPIAEEIEGVWCAPLDEVVKSKVALGRPKDLRDLRLISAFTGKALKRSRPAHTSPL